MTLHVLVDMNLSPSWVEVLRNAGFEAEHWSKLGANDAPDSELFEWARTQQYIVFTHDLDFGAMLNATQAESPSVFQVRTNDVSPEALAPRTIELLHRFTPQLLSGALVVVDEVRERVRVLPLRNDPLA
jgi:predicted nuclease of predicted toxin-antitoxin system